MLATALGSVLPSIGKEVGPEMGKRLVRFGSIGDRLARKGLEFFAKKSPKVGGFAKDVILGEDEEEIPRRTTISTKPVPAVRLPPRTTMKPTTKVSKTKPMNLQQTRLLIQPDTVEPKETKTTFDTHPSLIKPMPVKERYTNEDIMEAILRLTRMFNNIYGKDLGMPNDRGEFPRPHGYVTTDNLMRKHRNTQYKPLYDKYIEMRTNPDDPFDNMRIHY